MSKRYRGQCLGAPLPHGRGSVSKRGATYLSRACRQGVFALVYLLTLLLASSLAAQRGPATKSKAPPKLSDAQIEAAIRAKFAASKINADHFQVHVQGGMATLEGRTDVVQHKGTATRLAKTAGAVAVNNRIQVSEAARKKASANLAEGRRRAQVKRGEPRSEAGPPKTERK